jgi:signal transduction histidine kinase
VRQRRDRGLGGEGPDDLGGGRRAPLRVREAVVFAVPYREADALLSARAVPGSGLGLAVVREIARGHGAPVEAELPPGGGTLMRLILPLAQP